MLWVFGECIFQTLIVNIYSVTRKKNDFIWGPEKKEVFEQIKQEIVYEVALGPVWEDVKNVLYTMTWENGPYLEPLDESIKGDLRSAHNVLESGTQRIQAHNTPTEIDILAAHEGAQAV